MQTAKKPRKGDNKAGYLDGQFLVAMPAMSDKRFARSVIYMCAHSGQGAMGLIINQRAPHISFSELLGQLSIAGGETEDEALGPALHDMDVHVGGPVETGRGFVLHTSDYFAADSTLPIDAGVSLTATIDILKAIAVGKGPNRAILALGYAGWRPGQLESEIAANGWLHCPPDLDLLFDRDLDQKYERAMSKIGIDPSHLVSEAGHA
jgi:putative transcriptional regulator